MFVGSLALLGQLAVTLFATRAHDMLNVLLYARARVEGDVHDIQRCFTGLLSKALPTPLLSLSHV